MIRRVVIFLRDLPDYLEVRGENGKRAFYRFMVSKKKFGLGLNSVEPKTVKLLLQDERRPPKS